MPAVSEDRIPPDELVAARPSLGWIPWAIFILAFLAAAAAPLPDGLSRSGAFALAGLLAAVIFWASGVQDPSLSGLLIVTLLTLLGVMPFGRAVAGFGTEFIWLLVVTFILAQAMAETGLGRRIALLLLHRAGGRPAAVLLALLGAVAVLSFMVPTAAGRISMLLPVVLGIIEAARIPPSSRFAKAMLIGTSHLSIMAGIGLMTAAGATVYAAGLFSTRLGMQWTYVGWLIAFFPPVLVFTVAVWRLLLWLYPPERGELTAGAEYVADQLRRLGPLAGPERKMLAVFAAIFLLWVVGPRWGITTPQAGMIGALLLLLPGVQVLSWDRAMASVRWNVIVLFGVSLALADALERSGAGRWLTVAALSVVSHPSPAAVAVVVAPLVLLIRVGFVNNLGMIAVGLPLAFTLARGWGLDPVWTGMVVVMTAGPGLLLPTQTPTGMITVGYEYYTIRDYLRAGVPASVIQLLLTWLAAFVYWPLLGYRP
ncbi:MAG: SLC13 family permease [Armatimonadota bacterium]|nr:SLC13 family permease [Armatimonadota bacterium]MDR7452147.1 SLC13 family permease [Armatimonadota bacterium]MDR7467871.1 SLC13 family permease [Armatimonadota bacterium]MDR7494759.1 SLC13 family permease [Armatimonadota bacterium]MDR7499584.1 SLC13 family permease [Armatimonadota bacterium]